MDSYQIIKKLDSSQDSNKHIAVKYDNGKIKSEEYGAAAVSGHFLLMIPHGKFPPVYVKEIEEKGYIWLNEMGLEEYHDYMVNELEVPSTIAYTIPGVDPEKLELYFKYTVFIFLFDDAVIKLSELNKNNFSKHQKDILSVTESLILIIENHGNSHITKTAITKLNPIFEVTCTTLSYVCTYGFKHMNEDDYKNFARELLDFIRVNKWKLEYDSSPYSEKEYYLLRQVDGGLDPAIFLISWSKDIRLSDEIRKHPIYKRYFDNVSRHVVITNDILSLEKELPADEKLNLVLINCRKYSLQKSIHKVQKIANEVIINLKKDRIRLESYFPSDNNLKKFLESAEGVVDGFLYWHQICKRYGKIKYEKYVVEYNCDYDRWLENIGITNIENMKEPEFSSEFNR